MPLSKIDSDSLNTPITAVNLAYTGTLTGSTGVMNIGSGQVYKDASGNVGVGVVPSANWGTYKVIQLGEQAVLSGFATGAGVLNIGANFYWDGSGYKYLTTNPATLYQQNAGSHNWRVAASGTADAAISFNAAMTLDSSGVLMVGTTSVSAITGEATAKFQAAGNAVFGNAVASTNVTVTVNGVINKAGRIGFAESGEIKWLIGNGAASENGVFEVYSNTTGTGVQLGRSATSWSAASDERLKTALVPFENAASKVAALRAGTGRYLTDVESMSRSFLSAQSVQTVLPEAVDANTDEQATLSLRYTDVIPLLVAAIQEQQALITQQAEAITALTTRITALEGAAA